MNLGKSFKQLRASRSGKYTAILLGLSLTATVVWTIAALANQSLHYWYLLWNLVLAWIPFGLGFWLIKVVGRNGWRYGGSLVLGLLWLLFLPNTFYMLTDYVHLQEFSRVDVMLDIVMFTLFVLTSLALGFSSVLLVHRALKRRLQGFNLLLSLLAIFILCGFAMHLGRELRWNSWDMLSNPFGIIFNVSDLIIHPGAHPDAFKNTFLFSGFLVIVYTAIWRTSHILKPR